MHEDLQTLCISVADPIRIRRIRMLLDPDPDPSITAPSKNSKKNLESYCFVTSF
jgi:hypothetical protein